MTKTRISFVALGLVLVGGASAQAISSTTGFTFNLPAGTTLHNVYVLGNSNSGAGETFNPVLLPGSPTMATVGKNVVVQPAGFSVPTGSTAFNLTVANFSPPNSLINTTPNEWAVVGLYTDLSQTDHMILATNANLNGVSNGTVLPDGGLGLTEAITNGWLSGGVYLDGTQFSGGGTGLDQYFATDLQTGNYMSSFGQTAQIFFFSNGQPLTGASVTSNAFGTPVTPEPASLCLLAVGASALLTRRRR